MDEDEKHGLRLVQRRGNRKSGSAKRNGGTFIQSSAAVEREHRALTMLVKGHSQRAIAMELDMSESGVSYLIRRALARRAEALGPAIEHARVLLIERYERLLERWWPMATGDWVDPDAGTGENIPSKPAAEIVLRILADMAKILGADKTLPGAQGTPVPDPDPAASTSDIHLHFHGQGEREAAQANILATLTRMREKQHTIDGELAKVGTTQNELTGREKDDKPGPPPTRETQ